jgi:hypothetical protein
VVFTDVGELVGHVIHALEKQQPPQNRKLLPATNLFLQLDATSKFVPTYVIEPFCIGYMFYRPQNLS